MESDQPRGGDRARTDPGMITSNLPFDEWTETFGSERLTGALLDRLTHHVSILEMNGQSYRLAQSRARKTSRNP
ncbi:ATP-binding protein [Paracoccus saliphilus]|uniref:ATP-binding protein n=1 Tax=Paracoccus saliphilus TaxID=405559 RepID=UPI003457FB69